jgi:hypothetical protein
MDLQALSDHLLTDSLVSVYFDADDDHEIAQVVVRLPTQGFDEPLSLTVTQVETGNSMEGYELLQLYAPIPVQFDEAELLQLLVPVMEANEAVPLIGFNLHLGEMGFLYYRTVVLAPPGDAGIALVAEAIWLSAFSLDFHGASLIRSARGG